MEAARQSDTQMGIDSKLNPHQCDEWDQRLTLRPPPYTGAMSKMLPGIEVGDELIDTLPDATISPCHRQFGNQQAGGFSRQLPEPEWVDWTLVRRGQALWCEHLARTFSALMAALLQGFSIARFAVVLNHAGYAQTPLTSMNRYRSTSFFILDWLRHPLDDPDSLARRGIYQVRCMHGYARRCSKSLFKRDDGEGIPLSQYDMAEVQLGFTGVCLTLLEKEILMRRLPDADREAMVHVWRLIGWHLGIKDQFNVCSSVKDLDAYLEDFMLWTPQRLRTCREATHTLQLAAIAGFGKHTGLGVRYWEGFLAMLQTVNGSSNIHYMRVQPLPSMTDFAHGRLKTLGSSDARNEFASRYIVMMRELWRNKPGLANWVSNRLAPLIAAVHDYVIWRIISAALQVVALIRLRRQPKSMLKQCGELA